MSGGHWDYKEYQRYDSLDTLTKLSKALQDMEHTLDRGICGDTCNECAMLQAATIFHQALDAIQDTLDVGIYTTAETKCFGCWLRDNNIDVYTDEAKKIWQRYLDVR